MLVSIVNQKKQYKYSDSDFFFKLLQNTCTHIESEVKFYFFGVEKCKSESTGEKIMHAAFFIYCISTAAPLGTYSSKSKIIHGMVNYT